MGRGASLREAASPHESRFSLPRTSAAALSAAVDTTKMIRDNPNSQAEPPPKKRPRQTPAALRERGSGGEALLSEKRPLPLNLSHAPLRHVRGVLVANLVGGAESANLAMIEPNNVIAHLANLRQTVTDE